MAEKFDKDFASDAERAIWGAFGLTGNPYAIQINVEKHNEKRLEQGISR